MIHLRSPIGVDQPTQGSGGLLSDACATSLLMALAIRFDRCLREGVVADHADSARLGHVSRTRVTQIMNPLHPARDIQEAAVPLPPHRRRARHHHRA